jgi:ABC-type sugar transport system ATPase subunit
MSAITLENLTKVYATGVTALDELSLDVGDGELVVLVGPSGCGKTTALRMVAGLESITSGTLRFGGEVVNDVSPRHRDVAMVFQNYALYPHLTVAENNGFALTNKNVPKAERDRRVRAAAEALGLSGLLRRKPSQLSGGQRQRVAMARAIVREPAVFLMDEPLSNLDARLRVQMRAEVLRVHSQIGASTLYVTHDQVEAMTMGDRVAVLNDGTLRAPGHRRHPPRGSDAGQPRRTRQPGRRRAYGPAARQRAVRRGVQRDSPPRPARRAAPRRTCHVHGRREPPALLRPRHRPRHDLTSRHCLRRLVRHKTPH